MSILPVGGIQPTTATGYVSPPQSIGPVGGAGFQGELTGAIDSLQQMQATSNELSIKAVTGNLDDIHSATLASTRAQVTLELVAAVRNKGVDAFNDIMRMQA